MYPRLAKRLLYIESKLILISHLLHNPETLKNFPDIVVIRDREKHRQVSTPGPTSSTSCEMVFVVRFAVESTTRELFLHSQ